MAVKKSEKPLMPKSAFRPAKQSTRIQRRNANSANVVTAKGLKTKIR